MGKEQLRGPQPGSCPWRPSPRARSQPAGELASQGAGGGRRGLAPAEADLDLGPGPGATKELLPTRGPCSRELGPCSGVGPGPPPPGVELTCDLWDGVGGVGLLCPVVAAGGDLRPLGPRGGQTVQCRHRSLSKGGFLLLGSCPRLRVLPCCPTARRGGRVSLRPPPPLAQPHLTPAPAGSLGPRPDKQPESLGPSLTPQAKGLWRPGGVRRPPTDQPASGQSQTCPCTQGSGRLCVVGLAWGWIG